LLELKRFADSSVKLDGQTELFNEAEAAEPAPEDDLDENTDNTKTETIQYERRKSRGRKPLPADLPRARIEAMPTKSVPAQPIPRSNASAGLLAFIATAKCQDALPLHRQENIFKRMEIDIPRNTLANWMMRSGELMTPLITRLDSELRSGEIIECDETLLQVLNEPDRPASSQSYVCVRRSGAPDHPIVLYDYAPSRTGSVVENLLTGFSGYLQTDDYAGYHAVGRKHDISHVGYWAHARRKFIDAQKAANSNGKKTASAAIYSLIETAKANSLEPYAYLREVFTRLPSQSSDEESQTLLPWNVSRV
jgi:transposase